MNHKVIRALVLALPLVGLGATWGLTHKRAQEGAVWEVPIGGYDPRDLLRGHYVIYRYDWPGLDQDGGIPRNIFSSARGLCLHGQAPVIDKVTDGAGDDCENPVRADEYSNRVGGGPTRGRLYVSQEGGIAPARRSQR